MILNITALIVAYLGMEFIAWAMHKYVMHGFLWSLHRSHHPKGKAFFEKNDWYFAFFALLGSGFMLAGAVTAFGWMFYFGLGITFYGFTYLLVHDIIIHQRVRLLTGIQHPYINALRRAHRAHHANTGREGAVSFGMLWVDARYYHKGESSRTLSNPEKQHS